MIRVAAGERLRFAQADVKLKGWAVESRIYAEDPTRNFLPSTGRLVTYRPPEEGTHDGITVRNDTGVVEGGEISIYYDPMIAKLVTHAPTRAEAIAAQADALDAFVIGGIRHNIPFLSALMRHPRWRSGQLSTGFIAEEFKGGFTASAPAGVMAKKLAAVAIAVDNLQNSRKRQIDGQLQTPRPFQFSRDRVAMLGHERFEAVIAEEHEASVLPRIGILFTDDAAAMVVASGWVPGEPVWRGTVNGESVVVQVLPLLNGIALSHGGVATDARVYTRREATLAALMPEKRVADTSRTLLCPMPGLVKSIAVSAGQEVKAGETLAIVEAMKMENVLRAERDVTVKALRAKEGDSLAVDAVIMEFA
jgi:propionyl-CoA carboxylase alpha chain